MGQKFTIEAGTRTRVLRMFSSSIPSTINFEAVAKEGDVSGTIEVDRWHWFTWKRETLPLQAQNKVEKGFGDADFLIHVTPDQDCEVTFKPKGLNGSLFVVLLVAIVILAVAAAMIAMTAPPPGG